MQSDLGKDVSNVSNLGQGLVEETEKEVEERFIMNMCTHDFTIEQIAIATQKTVDEVQAIIDSNKAVLV
jgi:hypothetical protein